MNSPIALLIHAAPQAQPRYEQALGIPVSRVYIGEGSSKYDRNGLAGRMTLDAAVARYAPEAAPDAPVVLIGFSAGCWALRKWLRDPAARERCVAAVFVDGLHAGGSDNRANLSARHEGVIEYGRAAMNGERVLVISHSQIVPPGYASTRRTAEDLVGVWGLSRSSVHVDLHVDGLHVLARPGNDRRAHSDQLMDHGPQACTDYVFPRLELGPSDTDPAPPMPDPDAPLQVRALQWCLAEHEHWDGRKVPAERVREYLAGCRRRGKPLGLTKGNFCAAAQGFAEAQAALEDEQRPPWRAGAREPMADAKAGLRGRWHPISEIRERGYLPPPGSLAIYWRVSPADWRGHIERVVESRDGVFEAVGANEDGGRWVRELTPFAHERLLGFVVDAEPAPAEPEPLVEPPQDFAEHPLTESERQNIMKLAGLTAGVSFDESREKP